MDRLYSILIVDDNAPSAENLNFLLIKKNFLASCVYNSIECYEFLEKEKPDLILLDVVLPDIPGPELCKSLKTNKRFADIPVILLSGMRISAEEKAYGISCGAVDYVFRPFENDDLLKRIRSALLTVRDKELSSSFMRDSAAFEELGKHNTTETATLFNAAPVKLQYPESFDNAVKDYSAIIDYALDKRFFKGENPIHEKISKLTGLLCFLKAGAKDVIEIHRTTMELKTRSVYSKEAVLIIEEARYILLEIMGNMINQYRKTSF